MNVIAVGLGGFIGAILRYVTDELLSMLNGLVMSTLIVNLLGCFILGLFTYKVMDQINLQIRIGLTTGVIGSFTTFSTFSVETLALVTKGDLFFAILYVVITVVGGICLAFFGVKLAQRKGVYK